MPDIKKYSVDADRVLFTQLGDEAVLFDIKNNKYLSLNETFCSIFLGIQDKQDTEELKSRLMTEYAVEEDECINQLDQAIQKLLDMGFIRES